jgi:hypothetical protein
MPLRLITKLISRIKHYYALKRQRAECIRNAPF